MSKDFINLIATSRHANKHVKIDLIKLTWQKEKLSNLIFKYIIFKPQRVFILSSKVMFFLSVVELFF